MSKSVNITDETFEAEVVNSAIPVLVDFTAVWCPPCQMIAPILEEVASEKAGKLRVAKLNVDENPTKAAEFGVMSVPTLILFKEGKATERFVGYMTKGQLDRQLAPFL